MAEEYTWESLQRWMDEGRAKGAGYLLIVWDGVGNFCYPVYVMPHESFDSKREHYDGGGLQKLLDIREL